MNLSMTGLRGPKGPLAEQSVPDADCLSALSNGAARSSSGAACGCRPLRKHLRHYVPLFLGYALVRVIPRPSHEKGNRRGEAAQGSATGAVFLSALPCRYDRRVPLSTAGVVLIRRHSGVLHD